MSVHALDICSRPWETQKTQVPLQVVLVSNPTFKSISTYEDHLNTAKQLEHLTIVHSFTPNWPIQG